MGSHRGGQFLDKLHPLLVLTPVLLGHRLDSHLLLIMALRHRATRVFIRKGNYLLSRRPSSSKAHMDRHPALSNVVGLLSLHKLEDLPLEVHHLAVLQVGLWEVLLVEAQGSALVRLVLLPQNIVRLAQIY